MSLLSELWPYLAGLIAGLVALWKAYDYGKKAEKNKQLERRIDAIKDKKEIENEVDSLAPADLDQRFDRWVRK